MWKYCSAVLAVAACASFPGAGDREVRAESIDIPCTRDCSLLDGFGGARSNGGDIGVYAGRDLQGRIKRGLARFDVAAHVPAGSTITSATLTLNMDMTHFLAGAATVTLHRVQADWGEGTSAGLGGGAPAGPGDATWLYRAFDSVLWATAGGDFEASISASQLVGAVGTYTWTSAQLAADAQAMLNAPASNFGWLIKGDESTSPTAKRFVSREGQPAGSRPKLTVVFEPPLIITQWRSVRTHVGPVNLSIPLVPGASGNGIDGPAAETRSGGIQKIQVDFSKPVSAPPAAVTITGQTTVGGVPQAPAAYPPASVSMFDADTLEIVFSPGQLPDATCYTIDISPAMVTGLTGDHDVLLRGLAGDATMSGAITLSDALLTQARSGTPLAAGPQYDVDLDAAIEIDDVLIAKNGVGGEALCP